MSTPDWAEPARDILNPLRDAAGERIRQANIECNHLAILPEAALAHFFASVRVSALASFEHLYSVALATLRHLVESLTIIELGLIPVADQLTRWSSGRASQGQLRQWLERNTWSAYGCGLWEEPWSDFFGNLARSIQPYAHFTPELLQWQLAIIDNPVPSETGEFVGGASLGAPDESKSIRIALLNTLALWCLGRLVLIHSTQADSELESAVTDLGSTLAESEWLVRGGDWAEQLWPHVWESQDDS